MSTPLSEQTSAEKLEILGRKHAVSHFEKGNFLDSPNEEVQKWLDRNQVMTTQVEFDQLFDAYCKGFQSYHVEKWIDGLTPEQAADLRQRLTPSDPPQRDPLLPANVATHPLPVSVAQDDGCAVCGEVAIPFGPGICPKCRNPYRVIMAEDAFSEIETPSPTSSPVPAPLVPEVVKAAQEGSVCEVEPLGEVQPSLEEVVEMAKKELCKVGTQDRFISGFVLGWLRKSESSPPSSEDKELLTVVEEFLDIMDRHHGRWNPRDEDLVFDAIQKLRAAASTTTQKGGQ